MLNPEEEFIIDGVIHAYNLHPSNYADPKSAKPVADLTYTIGGAGSPEPQFNVPKDVYVDDWSVEDVANVLLKETGTHSGWPIHCLYTALRMACVQLKNQLSSCSAGPIASALMQQ